MVTGIQSTEAGQGTLADDYASRTDVCGPFCDATPEVSFEDEHGDDVHWCSDCYEKPCGRCREPIDDDENQRKKLCQDCRDDIRNGNVSRQSKQKQPAESPVTQEQTKLTSL
jgi:hypothetical protein